MTEYLMVGEILKPQGIQGEVKVRPITNDPMRFEDAETLYLCENGQYIPVGCRFVRFDGQAVYLKLEGVSDKWVLKTVWGVGYKFEVKETDGGRPA